MAAQFGRRLRRGATTTAVAAAAIAALAASQAPGVTPSGAAGGHAADATPPPGPPVSGNSQYHTELPPLDTSRQPGTSTDAPDTITSQSGIPGPVLAAYMRAEKSLAETNPGCNLPWQLLAAIGQVESGQASNGNVDASGNTKALILGPVLNGVGFANISDTDDGQYDHDSVHDRAIGPMQFIPSTWESWAQDGNADGVKDPSNIYDAALGAGAYLCADGRDLSVEHDLHSAILGYNHSQEYLTHVLAWMEYFTKGTYETPAGAGIPAGNGPTSPGTPSPGTTGGPSAPGTTPTTPAGTPPTTPPGTPPTTPPGSPSTPPASGSPDGGTAPPTPPNGGWNPPSTGTPATTPPTKPPTVPKPPTVQRLVKAATGTLTATAGNAFTAHAAVRAEDLLGRAVSKVTVQFAIVGSTDARFPGGASTVTVTTGAGGLATAPALQAGEQTGGFTVRATVGAAGVSGADFAATVTAPQADGLARTGDQAMTAAPGAEFAEALAVRATYKGAAAPGVAVSATITSVDGAGPHFLVDGAPVRSLTGLRTGADGVLQVPKILADSTAGTFQLTLETAGGATLKVVLTVA